MAKHEQKARDALLGLDAAAHRAVRPHRRHKAVEALSWYSEIGDQPQLRALGGGLLALGLVRGDGRMARAGARMLLAHELATAAKNFVKHRIDRSRPRSASGREEQKPTPGRSSDKEETSFPSGHSAGAVAAARAFAREFPEHQGAALAAAGAAALAQIPRCAHYPTDVGAGIALGAAAEAIVDLAWRAAASRLNPAPAPAIPPAI